MKVNLSNNISFNSLSKKAILNHVLYSKELLDEDKKQDFLKFAKMQNMNKNCHVHYNDTYGKYLVCSATKQITYSQSGNSIEKTFFTPIEGSREHDDIYSAALEANMFENYYPCERTYKQQLMDYSI